jgi:phosphomannomutase/phosphoglucomutase
MNTLFRAYDIRGVYGKDLTEEFAEKIGKAFGTLIGKGKRVGIGRDIRLSSQILKDFFVEGLRSAGCSVVDFGLIPTPLVYFGVIHRKFDAGVMVTASHLSPEWNGFKLCDSKGIVLSEGTGLEHVREIFEKGNFSTADHGSLSEDKVLIDEYKKFVKLRLSVGKKLKVVVDAVNSVPGLVVPELLRELGLVVFTINQELNGAFPNRPSEITEESLQKLKLKVLELNADLGIGFDGDGDRVGFVDEKGDMVFSGNIVLPIFANYILPNSQRKKVVFDVSCSAAVEDVVKAKGGMPIVIRVGHSYCSHTVEEENAAFGGQYSGHYAFPEIYSIDDAIYAAVKMVEIISKESKKFSEIVAAVPRYFTKMEEIPCEDNLKFEIVERIKKKVQAERVVDVDGVKAYTKDGWVLIRASNTSPMIRVISEGRTEGTMEKLLEYGKKLVTEENGKGVRETVILAGGLGTRLRPIIGNGTPKVMALYDGKPLLQRTIEVLREKNIREIIVVVSHLKEKIIDYFGDGGRFGVHIQYPTQENPRGGTADALSTAKSKVKGDKFLLIYGDNIFHSKTLDELLSVQGDYDGIICGKEVENPSKFGILELEGSLVKKIHEKPKVPPSNIANTGLFILPKEIFSAIEETKISPRGEYELTDSIQILINRGRKIGCVILKDFWFDPRDVEEIKKAEGSLKNARIP